MEKKAVHFYQSLQGNPWFTKVETSLPPATALNNWFLYTLICHENSKMMVISRWKMPFVSHWCWAPASWVVRSVWVSQSHCFFESLASLEFRDLLSHSWNHPWGGWDDSVRSGSTGAGNGSLVWAEHRSWGTERQSPQHNSEFWFGKIEKRTILKGDKYRHAAFQIASSSSLLLMSLSGGCWLT